MNQHDSHVIRTLSEAMINLQNLGRLETVNLVEREIQSMLGYTAPPTEAGCAEADAQPDAPALHSLANQVLEIVGDNCPHCLIVDHILAGKELPLGTENFLYGIALGGGYNALADIMKDVAETLDEKRKEMSDDQRQQFAVDFARFTEQGIAVRKRLADEELAPPLNPLSELLGPLLAQASEALRQRLAQQGQ